MGYVGICGIIIFYFILDMIFRGQINWPGIVCSGMFAMGMVGFLIKGREDKKKEEKEKKERVEAIPEIEIKENGETLKSVGEILENNGLELRIKRVGVNWNVAFVRGGTVPKIVGVGSAVEIDDAMIKAEADFLEKV